MDDGKVWVSELVNGCTVFAKFKKMAWKEADMDRQRHTKTHLAILPILPGCSRSCKTVKCYRMSLIICWLICPLWTALLTLPIITPTPARPWHYQLQTAPTGRTTCTVLLQFKHCTYGRAALTFGGLTHCPSEQDLLDLSSSKFAFGNHGSLVLGDFSFFTPKHSNISKLRSLLMIQINRISVEQQEMSCIHSLSCWHDDPWLFGALTAFNLAKFYLH